MDYTREFPHIVFALKNLKRRVILDGEIVALDEQGRANFQELQNRKSTKFPIVYYAFDVLHENGKDLLDLPSQTEDSDWKKSEDIFLILYG